MATIKVKKLKTIPAEITVPGDKSISHRSAMFAGLAKGTTIIDGFLPSEDCLCTVKAMVALGATMEPLEEVEGVGLVKLAITGSGRKLKAPASFIDCGNSGTTMRLLSGILSAQPFTSELRGDESLSRRPMKRVADPLTQMGAVIEGHGMSVCAPLRITGGALQPINYTLPMASAQVKSAVLLAGMLATGKTTVIESVPTRNHTESLMTHFGVKWYRKGDEVTVYGNQEPQPNDMSVPGDISSAAFWMVAAAATPEAQITIRNVGLNPTRTGIITVLLRMGAQVTQSDEKDDGEPFGNITVKGGELHGTHIGGADISNVIDELPILAVAAALARGNTLISDAQELRVKETDRIAAVAKNLRAMGVTVQEFDDGMEIEGGAKLHGATIETYGDHRIAMAFAIAGMFAEGQTLIEGAECIATSYPGFESALNRFIGGESEVAAIPVLSRVPRKVGERLSIKKDDAEKPVSAAVVPHVIAIDGPAASGKSSVARRVAERLGWTCVNTGNMYRAITWAILNRGIDASDAPAVAMLAASLPLEFETTESGTSIRIDGHVASAELTSDAVNRAVSLVAAVPAVRERLVSGQRALASRGPLVMEGRDIGSVVFPDAAFKFYIDASEEVRSARRQAQGHTDRVGERDRLDTTRKNSPLVTAADAVVIDSSRMTLDEVVEHVLSVLRSRGLAGSSAG